MEKKRVRYLFDRYYSGAAGPEEREEFLKLIAEGNHAAGIEALLLREIRREKGEFTLTPEEIEEMKSRLFAGSRHASAPLVTAPPLQASRPSRLKKMVNVPAFYYAAAILLLAGTSAFYFLMKNTSTAKTALAQTITIKTAYGEQRRVVLPDSSRVWMNAMSTLTYPAGFGNDERRVEVSGEIYFEIQTDLEKAFVAKTGQVYVRVLGTRFLINAYDEESDIRISLLKGSVAVQQRDKKLILKAGEQMILPAGPGPSADSAFLKPVTDTWQVNRFDEKETLAWKNGSFKFNNTELPAVLRQLARWYGFRPEYPEGVPFKRISGEIQQDLPLPGALQVLSAMDIHCKLEGDRLIIRH